MLKQLCSSFDWVYHYDLLLEPVNNFKLSSVYEEDLFKITK
jgi:hypothetical protein